jgi:hypothetical protein
MRDSKKKMFCIKEQVVNDTAVTGLILEFKVKENGEFELFLTGLTLPFGNREIQFNKNGDYVGAGTYLGSECNNHDDVSD